MRANALPSIPNPFVERQNCGVRVSDPTLDERSPSRPTVCGQALTVGEMARMISMTGVSKVETKIETM
jgi:hypothetical protein